MSLSGRLESSTIKDYIEVSKPRIVIVLVITAVTSMLAATRFDGSPNSAWDISIWKLLFLIVCGSLSSMGASAINQFYDKNIDNLMIRTSKRPIPSGRLKANNVLIYGLALSAAAVILAWFTLNPMATFMIALGIFFYVVIYTLLLKRRNVWNIVIGGFAGSAASMAGWATTTNGMDLLGFLVGWIVFMWTPPHFWCLAIKTREEYSKAHVPMLPVVYGDKVTAKYIFINSLILIPYSISLYFFGLGILYLVVAAASGTLMTIYHYKLLQNPNPEFAWKAYKVTAPYLVIIFIAIALDSLWYFRF
ncbi:heme o synthase [Candidatus Nitrosocosmicus hydrocola]|uniref:heme o synthase n=1 Tax=Candidatus Nitrosocosmicus hydrocola TaxID=1826872 RepID=UPI000AC516A2|nr:heme o synthase [Candidatus Nitrosocosmicus hydrocola]